MSIKKGNKVIAGAPLEPVWGTISGEITDQEDLQQTLAQKVNIDSPAFTGTPTSPTPPSGSNDDRIATTSYVQSAIQSSGGGLPDQTGHSGQYLTTNGTSASWGTVDALPSQSGQTGKFLTTDGTSASWSDTLPSQSGNSGKFLTTNGTAVSWATVTADSEIEWATYGTTTLQQVKDWYDAGKAVFVKKDNVFYTLCSVNNIGAIFSAVNDIGSGANVSMVGVNYDNSWYSASRQSQQQIPAGTSGNILTYTGTAGSVGSATINDIVPTQSGNSGKFLTTDGSAVSWANVDALPSQTSQSGKFLTTNGTSASWSEVFPSQSGNFGKYLTTNGTTVSWATVDSLPTQAGNSGKFLTTDGSNSSWADIPTEIPSQSGNNGKVLTTNGTTTSWTNIEDNNSITKNSSNKLQANGVINQSNTSNAIKVWTGTKEQYEAIATKDANTLYNITDDASEQVVAHTDLDNLTFEGKNISNWSTNITNCVVEIPQDIKLELNNGNITIKSGTIVYTPDGTSDTITEDIISDTENNPNPTANGEYLVFSGHMISQTHFNTIRFGKIDKICSGATDSLSEAGDHTWYDTTEGVIKHYTSNGTINGIRCLPLAKITVSNNVISSIDKVFNGFGYLGSTVFVLPGVKGVYPSGRNPDGSLKNTAITTSTVLLNTISGSGIYHIMLTTNSLAGFVNVFYDLDKNILYNNGNPQISRVDCGIIKRASGGVVSEIYSKNVLDVFDRSTEVQEDLLKGMSLNLKKDFGARGNNVDDDTDALQKAFDYCVENNKTLYIPAGTYKISSVETKKTYSTDERKCLKIVGTSGTILNVSGSITIGNHLTQYIQDLFINGTSKTAAAVVIGNDDAAYNGYYKGVRIMGDPLAVYFKHAFDIGFEDCRFVSQNHYEEPVDIQPTMKFGKGSADWNIDQSPNCITFTRCQWEGTGGNGAQVYFSDENSCRSFVISFLGCHFETRNRNSRAFYIKTGQTIGFYNCTFTNNDYMNGTDTHTRVPNYIEHAEGINIVNCTFDRYTNKLIEFGDTNTKFFNILATTQQQYEPTGTNPDAESYKELSTFFTLNGSDTTSWHCSIHNGLNTDDVYEYGNVYGKPGIKFTDLTIGATGALYTSPEDCYYNFEMNSGAAGEKIKLINQHSGATRQIAVSEFSSASGQKLSIMMPASKGDNVVIVYDTSGTAGQLRRVSSKGTY